MRCSRRSIVLAAWLISTSVALKAAPRADPAREQAARAWMQTVLTRWEAACRRDLRDDAEPLPWMIFYDAGQAWHLNPDRQWLPPQYETPEPIRLLGRARRILVLPHVAGSLWVPGRDPMPLGASRAPVVTIPYANERKSVVIVPVPSVFRTLAAADQSSALDELFLGLSIHELTHTRQITQALRQINALRAQAHLPEHLDDNLIQQEFGTDQDYVRLYVEERQHLGAAIVATDPEQRRRDVMQALSIARQRKARFFAADKRALSGLEDVLLVLEGTAMWMQYRTARDRAPAGEEWLQTLTTLSQRHDAWSQEEGLALFLLIDRLVPRWQRRFMGATLPSPFDVLQEAVDRQRRPTKASGATP